MPLYPAMPILALAALAYVIWANWADPAVGRPSLLAYLATAVVAAIYCLFMRRRRGPGWTVASPAPE
jgi:L-asparagine transporter-like permease